jgi:hypothetical protein
MDYRTMEHRIDNGMLGLQVTWRDDRVSVRIEDRRTGRVLVDDAYMYRVQVRAAHGSRTWEGLQGATVAVVKDALQVSGQLGPLRLEQCWTLLPDRLA